MKFLSMELIEELKKYRFKAKTTSVEHINEIKDEIAHLKERSWISEEFYNQNLAWMDFNLSNTMPDAKSILIIAVPQFITRLKIEYNGGHYTFAIPPTYVYSDVYKKVEDTVNRVLMPQKYSIIRTKLPAKLLAVRSRLGTYGRNNICYVNGMGSFYRLFTFYTDMPCNEDNWRETAVMPECGKCKACITVCPTGAIDDQRFLIHAEKCITNYNEREGDFPEWFHKAWHNAVVGCVKCQAVCPKNREFISRIEIEVAFNHEETEAILLKKPLEQLPHSLKQKLDKLDMTEYYDVLQRNLSVLIS